MVVYAVVVLRADARKPEGAPVYLGEFREGYPQTGSVSTCRQGYAGVRYFAYMDAARAAQDLDRFFGCDLDGRRYVFGVRPVEA